MFSIPPWTPIFWIQRFKMTGQQEEIFAAQTTWFHVFKDMIDSGDMAKLPATAVKIYLVIKAHINFTTGCSFPALETIVEKSGVSRAQVMRDLKALEDKGYLTKEKRGRSNVYHLREKIEIKDDTGRPAAVATWDYLPGGVREAVADLKNVLITGEFEGAKIVHIERLQVNVNHAHDHATIVNVQNIQQLLGSLEAMPEDLRERVIRAMAAQKAPVDDSSTGKK